LRRAAIGAAVAALVGAASVADAATLHDSRVGPEASTTLERSIANCPYSSTIREGLSARRGGQNSGTVVTGTTDRGHALFRYRITRPGYRYDRAIAYVSGSFDAYRITVTKTSSRTGYFRDPRDGGALGHVRQVVMCIRNAR
jgi:hypothetical protein